MIGKNILSLPYVVGILFSCLLGSEVVKAATTRDTYYAHKAVEDKYGVIAPWYKGQNGQCDFRLRIAVETLKRYPWIGTDEAVMAAPQWVYGSLWKIDENGAITIPELDNWMCGDLSQRMGNLVMGMIGYYRYTGDPAAVAFIKMYIDYVLDYTLTPADYPWPKFPISVPTKGKPYGQCDPGGLIQLDLSAAMGGTVLSAHKLIGDDRYLAAAMHWADEFAEKCNFNPEYPPWDRYAVAESVYQQKPGAGQPFRGWSDLQTHGTVLTVDFLDEVIRLGHKGRDSAIVKARDAGLAYLKDKVLPNWTDEDMWGHHYWDWDNPVYGLGCVYAVSYFMDHPEIFPNWRTDARNILSLYLNKVCVDPESRGDVYSGAWSVPEGSMCCGESHGYVQYMLGPSGFAKFAALTNDEWAREMARRIITQCTYDALETGQVFDGLFGDIIVGDSWFNLAHPLQLLKTLEAMSWLPDIFGPNRENHILRSSSVVNRVVYRKGQITYSTFDAPAETVDVLRLAFTPSSVKGGGKKLSCRKNLKLNGYTIQELSNGDCIVKIRHDGLTNIVVEGPDPQEEADDMQLKYQGEWSVEERAGALNGAIHVTAEPNSAMSFSFVGNQVRLIGSADPQGGMADIYIDGEKQLVPLDCWSPYSFDQRILYYRNGLSSGEHELKIVARGEKNLLSTGKNIYVDAIQYSAATGDVGFGKGGGPTGTQRMIFGYAGSQDYVDSNGNEWRPGTEFVIRSGKYQDSVANSWWTRRRTMNVRGESDDPELYRYGVHGKEFWVNVTVGPGQYYVNLKFASTPNLLSSDGRVFGRTRHVVTVLINGEEVISKMDVAEAADGRFKALDRIFKNISPRNGVIEIHFKGCNNTEAIIQAVEVGPMSGQADI